MILLAGLERTLNALLARDPAAPARLARLADSRLLLCLERPHRSVLLHYHARGVHLQRGDETGADETDARVALDMPTLLELLSGASVERLMLSGRLQVRGNTALLEATRDLLLDIDLDWEGWLAGRLGDTAAHQLAEGARSLSSWAARSGRQLRADIGEFVFEEAHLLPGRHQFEALRDHLTELEVATDRLEARVERLRQQLEEESAP